MSSLWDVPQYLIMAFSLALDAPAGKASRVAFSSHSNQAIAAPAPANATRALVPPPENVWLRAVKIAGAHSDVLQPYATRIFVTSTGRYYVATPKERAEILGLRHNPEIATRVLAAATKTLQQDMHSRMHRQPTRGALLIAHMLGEDAGFSYMQALAHDPSQRAARAIPAVAAMIGDDPAITIAQMEARLGRTMHQHEAQIAAASTLKGTDTKTGKAGGEGAAKLASR